MLQQDIITKLLGLSSDSILTIKENKDYLGIVVQTPKKLSPCPFCGASTSKIHDYRRQIVKDSNFFRGKQVRFFLLKRRYECKNCRKSFTEKYDFLPRYAHFSSNLYWAIINDLHTKDSVKDISARYGVSPAVTFRLLKKLPLIALPPLPVVLGIDEFKGNSGGEKYQCILTDIQHKRVINILPTRFKRDLISYFLQYPRVEREKVRVFVMDMWDDYRDISWLFPNAVVVADRYHWIRQVNWALDKVRKRVQEEHPSVERSYFKRFRLLLQKKRSELDDNGKLIVQRMIDADADLREAYNLKELFYEFKDCKSPYKAGKLFRRFIKAAEELNIPEFEDCVRAYHNWGREILNSYRHRYTNGYTEGINNTIKVIKRIAYGYRNFHHFKKRILFKIAG